MLRKTNNLLVAETILSAVNAHLSGQDNYDLDLVWVEAYQNGREQGYSIAAYNKKGLNPLKISFSENRNSDAIVVYAGEHSNQGLSHDAYGHAQYFRYGEYQKAAEYICSLLPKKQTIEK
jgi:hypothetical protein